MPMMTTILPILLAASVPAYVPPPPRPKSSDWEVWTLARKVDTAEGYTLYLGRFPRGSSHDEAVRAYYRVRKLPVVETPRTPRSYAPLPEPPAPALNPPDPCHEFLFRSGAEAQAEVASFRAAEASNRVADYQAFLDRYPAGVCSLDASAMIQSRAALKRGYPPIPGFGPLAPRRSLEALRTDESDYPPSAIRAEEQGRVEAEFDVAEDGVVESCHVIASSGSEALDRATCRLFTARLRYDPARDASGAVTRSRDHAAIGWALPSD